MLNGMFVFDCVIHAYDMSDENLREDRHDAELSRQQMLGPTKRPTAQPLDYARRWSGEDLYDLVFNQAQTDMAMAQVVPIYDWYKDWFAPVKAQYEMAAKYPDRVLFCGGVDPIVGGLDEALYQLEYQVDELGARSIKFYNGHIDASWRCDDREIAYPMYEKCQELGIDVIQFHKGVPFGLQSVEQLSPLDIQGAARDFPDLKFLIHHLALPYFDEVVNIAARFPNVYLPLSGTFAHYLVGPRRVMEQLGRLLLEVGVDKLLWGSEAALAGGPRPYLDAIATMRMPESLMEDYGYPEFTDEDKRKILGLNFAKLMNVDVEQAQARLAKSPTGWAEREAAAAAVAGS
jgi:predicted TIM-barrel fold metal-dependent hydrolase